MVKKIQSIGTILILFVLLTGSLIILSTKVSFDLKMKGHSNKAADWFTQNTEINLNWLKDLHGNYGKYDKEKSSYERYRAIISGIEDNTEQFATGAFPKIGRIKWAADIYKAKVLHNRMEVVIGGKTNEEYAKEAVHEVKVFEDYLKSSGIDFIYVQVPCGARIRSYAYGTAYPTAELDRPDRLSKIMNSEGIAFLDINRLEDELKGFSLDGSDHWKPHDALVTTKYLAEEMNTLYGYSFDLSKFDSDNYFNSLELARDKQEIIKQQCGYDYVLYAPLFQTSFQLDYCEENVYEGDFIETLLTPIDNWDRRLFGSGVIAYHDMWTIRNEAYVDIKNKLETGNPGKRVLVLGDSFAWPVASYLSVDVEELAYVNPRFFDGNVRKYIDIYKPDTVIWVYQEQQCGAENDLSFACVNR